MSPKITDSIERLFWTFVAARSSASSSAPPSWTWASRPSSPPRSPASARSPAPC